MKTLFNWRNYQPESNLLKGKNLLITGAADGIGRAVSIRLAEYGATVIMLDKKSRHLETLYDHIVKAGHTEPVILPVDLNTLTPESATQIAQAIKDDFNVLHGCLHNGAELGSPSPLSQYDIQYYHDTFQTNMHASYYLSRAVLPLLANATQAQLLFTTADVGREPQAYWGAYAMAYAAVEAQMRLWAQELENTHQIQVNSIDPGAVRTPLRRRSHPGEVQDSLISPQDISLAYVKLFSQENTYHGQKLCLQ